MSLESEQFKHELMYEASRSPCFSITISLLQTFKRICFSSVKGFVEMFMFKTLFLAIICLFSHLSFASVSQWIDFQIDRGHIYIPVIISGVKSHALLDTGAQGNAINTRFVEKHKLDLKKGKEVYIKGLYATSKRKSFTELPVVLFRQNTTFNQITAISLGHHSTGMLIGAPFFNRYIVQLDYPNSRMRIMSRDSVDLAKLKNIDLRQQKKSGVPMVKVEINDESVWLLLDTGSNGSVMLDRKLALSLKLNETIYDTGRSRGVNTSAKTHTAKAHKFKFGPFEFENVDIRFVAEGEKANLKKQYGQAGSRIKSKKIRGILGFDILKHFVVTLDYKSGKAHIAIPPP